MVAAPSTNGHAQPPASLSRQGSSFFGTAKDAAQAAFAVVNQAASPLPTTPDGLTNLQAKAPTDAAPTNGLLKGLFNDILAGRVDESESLLSAGVTTCANLLHYRRCYCFTGNL